MTTFETQAREILRKSVIHISGASVFLFNEEDRVAQALTRAHLEGVLAELEILKANETRQIITLHHIGEEHAYAIAIPPEAVDARVAQIRAEMEKL